MELALRFAAGGEAELEEAIAIYGERLVRYAASILCSYQDAEDVVQAAFLYAYENRRRFNGGNLQGWLKRITYCDCLDRLKSQKRRRIHFFFDINEEPSVHMQDTLVISEIDNALKQLNPKERALLYGRIIEGYSYEELSQIMGPSPVALRKQYERVKKKAVKFLTECGYEADFVKRRTT